MAGLGKTEYETRQDLTPKYSGLRLFAPPACGILDKRRQKEHTPVFRRVFSAIQARFRMHLLAKTFFGGSVNFVNAPVFFGL